MKRKGLLAGAIVAVLSMAFAPFAAADDLVTFTTSTTSSRTVSAVTPPVFPDTNLSVSGGSVTAAPASATLTEIFATGSTWSVKAQMCSPNNYASPTSADCTTGHADRMVRADGDTIPGSQISVSQGDPVVAGLPRSTNVAKGSDTDLGSQITLLSSTDEVSGTTYNGIYTTATTLSIADLFKTGTWKGYWVITQTT